MTQAVIPSLRTNMGFLQVKGAFQVAMSPGAITTGTTVIVTPTVPGTCKCDFGDIVLVGPGNAALLGVTVTAYVSAANTIKVAFANTSAGTITPTAAASYTLIVVPGETGEFIA